MARPQLPENQRKVQQARLTDTTAKKIKFIIMFRNKKETFEDIIATAIQKAYPHELAKYDQFQSEQDDEQDT